LNKRWFFRKYFISPRDGLLLVFFVLLSYWIGAEPRKKWPWCKCGDGFQRATLGSVLLIFGDLRVLLSWLLYLGIKKRWMFSNT
jgi:hypothetical protein